MNKQLLAYKLFNLNKKPINEITATDSGMGNLQDIASFGSLAASFLPGARFAKLAKIGAGVAAGVAMTRNELDKSGVLPSRTGNLDTMANITMGRVIGLATAGKKYTRSELASLARRAKRGGADKTEQRRIIAGDMDTIRRAPGQELAHQAVLFGGITGKTPALALGAMMAGQSKYKWDDTLAVVGSSELGRSVADPISSMTGLPLIPGLSTRLTEKEPLATERSRDISVSQASLALVNAANARRQG